MNLIIDVGNTRVKAAVYKEDTLIELYVFKKSILVSKVREINKKHAVLSAIMSSVALITDKKVEKLQSILPFLLLNASTKVPFINLYQTPKTLGVDRIALMTSAVKLYPNKNVLVIDAGTCITFDFINDKKEYFGGAISPGIKMRYRSLHTFTSKLPLLEKKQVHNFIGNNTTESIDSGVVNGVCQEIDGVISQYKKKYSLLTVVLTGGDSIFLAKQLKSSIFANQNFLLQGLNEILIFNRNE
jgi:type III pantothenate kinase